jgi:hypothetical protein
VLTVGELPAADRTETLVARTDPRVQEIVNDLRPQVPASVRLDATPHGVKISGGNRRAPLIIQHPNSATAETPEWRAYAASVLTDARKAG